MSMNAPPPHMTHLVLPHMVNHSGRDSQCNIVSTTSVGGLTGVINQADYCASKSGLIGLTRGLALEYLLGTGYVTGQVILPNGGFVGTGRSRLSAGMADQNAAIDQS